MGTPCRWRLANLSRTKPTLRVRLSRCPQTTTTATTTAMAARRENPLPQVHPFTYPLTPPSHTHHTSHPFTPSYPLPHLISTPPPHFVFLTTVSSSEYPYPTIYPQDPRPVNPPGPYYYNMYQPTPQMPPYGMGQPGGGGGSTKTSSRSRLSRYIANYR